jgi:regulator of protease activity HflC (stomatin/prohibitin superfamily)
LFVCIVLFLIAFAGAAASFVKDLRPIGIPLFAIVSLILLLMSFSQVDARSVGVVTAGGKYVSSTGPGVHFNAPWSSTEEWSTRNQVIRFEGDGKSDERDNYKTEPRITVRLGNQSEAYIDATVTWQITEVSVQGLWKQHKTFDDARRDFITPSSRAAVNAAFDGYDPLAGLNATDKPTTDGKPTDIPLEEWSRRVTELLRPMFRERSVELLSVQVTFVHYDERTQGKLREYADAVANTRIKAQDVETAKKEAEASAERAKRASGTGNDCLSLIRDLAASGQLQYLPPGLNLCAVGQAPQVIVDGRK